MERCPVCRASLNDDVVCRRCRTDLQQVEKIEGLALELTGAVMIYLVDGNTEAARRLLARARFLHNTPEVRALWKVVS